MEIQNILKKDNVIDKYFTFIASLYSLISFDKNGDFSSIFFPDKDYYQNLSFSNSWVLFKDKLFALNNDNFYIDMKFLNNFEILNIYFFPKYKIIKQININSEILLKIKNKIFNDSLNKNENIDKYLIKNEELFVQYKKLLLYNNLFLLKQITYSKIRENQNNEKTFIDNLKVKIYKNDLNLSNYIEYFNWKIKDSYNYHSISILEKYFDKNGYLKDNNEKSNLYYLIKIIKQDIEINFRSKGLKYFFPIPFKCKNNNINDLIFNFLDNLLSNELNKHRKDIKNFSIIGMGDDKSKFNKFYIKNYEMISNKYFSFYDFINTEKNFIEVNYSFIFINKNIKLKEEGKNKTTDNNFEYNNKINNFSLTDDHVSNKNTNPEDNLKTYSDLEKSSIYVLTKLQTRSGAILASFEQDENFESSGGYGFCWGRDAAIIVDIMSKIGFKNYAKRFFKFIFNALDGDDHIHQRYYADGLKAPSWGDQYDETGLVLWSLNNYYEKYNDTDFIIKNKGNILKLVNFLITIYDKQLNLFFPSFDLWEERYGYHLFTQISCIEGLKSGIDLLESIGEKKIIKSNFPEPFSEFYIKFIENILQLFIYNEDRIIDIKRSYIYNFSNHSKHSNKTFRQKSELSKNENKPKKNIIIQNGFYEDKTFDVSNLCLIYPFNIDVLTFEDRITLIYLADKILKNKKNSFHFRYKDDVYKGGNSWIISTLWIILSKIEMYKHKKNFNDKFLDKKELLKEINDVIKKLENIVNSTGFLPEQIDENMNPLWIQPLAWTHALVLELYNKKNKLGGNL